MCYQILRHCAHSDRVRSAWLVFTEKRRITNWHAATAPIILQFHDHLNTLHNLRPPETHWHPRRNLVSATKHTFSLTCSIDGEMLPTNFHSHIHPWHSPHTCNQYLSTVEPVRLVWCVQYTAPPFEPLLSRARRGLHTTAVIVCPDTHKYHAIPSEITDVHLHALARAPKLTTHRTDVLQDQTPCKQFVTFF